MTMRITVLVFSVLVLAYAINAQGTSIYEMVSGAYQVTLVGAFVPLVCGLYWARATTQGAVLSIVLGILVWLAFLYIPAGPGAEPDTVAHLGDAFPAQLAGILAAFVGMFAGSLAPQVIANTHGSHRKHPGMA